MEHQNQYALVTGATSGIGYELARLFAENGYNLVIVARSQHELQNCAKEFLKHGINVVPMERICLNPVLRKNFTTK